MEWKPGDEPYYPVNDEENNALYQKYKKEIEEKKLNSVVLVSISIMMDAVVASALDFAGRITLGYTSKFKYHNDNTHYITYTVV